MNAKIFRRLTAGDKEAWLKARKLGVTGTDIATIAGLSPWSTISHIYTDKVDPNIREIVSSEAMTEGQELESWVANRWSKQTGRKIKRVNAILQHPEHPWMLANIDRLVMGPEELLEVKTSGSGMGWTEGPPDYVLAQVHWYLAVTGLAKAHVALYAGGNGGFRLRDWEIPRCEETIAMLMSLGQQFWKCVQERTPPAKVGDDIIPVNIQLVEPIPTIDPALIPMAERLLEVTEQRKALEKEEANLKEQFRCFMGDYEQIAAGELILSNKSLTSFSLDQQMVKNIYPDVFNTCCVEKTQKRFSIKEGGR